MASELVALVAVASLAVVAIGVAIWAIRGWRRTEVDACERLLAAQETQLRQARFEATLHRDRAMLFGQATERLANAADDPERLHACIVEMVAAAVGADGATLHRVDQNHAGPAPAVAAFGLAPGALPSVIAGQGYPGRAWLVARTVQGPAQASSPGAAETHGYEVAVPITHAGVVLAVAWLVRTQANDLPSNVLSVADQVAHLGGLALARYDAHVLAGSARALEAQLRGAERVKDEFLATISHELRTPLTSIIGYLDLALDDPATLDGETQGFLEVVQRNARRLLRLVGDLLFVAQVEAGQLSFSPAEVDLGEVAAEAVQAIAPRAADNEIAVTLRAEPGRPVTADRDRLGQLLDNLLSNAVKFSRAGDRVDVGVVDTGSHAELTVADTGLGIEPRDLDRMFVRFFRSSDATRQAVDGVGLGLTIVKAIVDAHEGTVHVTSEVDRGTTVRVTIPYAASIAEPLADPVHPGRYR